MESCREELAPVFIETIGGGGGESLPPTAWEGEDEHHVLRAARPTPPASARRFIAPAETAGA